MDIYVMNNKKSDRLKMHKNINLSENYSRCIKHATALRTWQCKLIFSGQNQVQNEKDVLNLQIHQAL